jgi:pimeloyl-ACP methyl ester carboxylesterase
MKQKRIKVKGKEISYYESKDNGHPVVFVHGTSSSSSIFIRQLIDSVLSYQFRFIALDLIGYGKSDVSENPEEDYTIAGLSDCLIQFSKELDLKDAVYVGHDLGANIIIESYNDFNNPKGLVLLGAVPFSNPISDQTFLKDAFWDLFSKAGVDDSEVHQIASYFVEEHTHYPDFVPEIIRSADIKTREFLFDSIKKSKYKDQIEIINDISVPIAVYYGEFDQIINFDYLNTIEFPTIWRTIVQIIRDVGHMFFYESPADFNVNFEAYLHFVFNK